MTIQEPYGDLKVAIDGEVYEVDFFDHSYAVEPVGRIGVARNTGNSNAKYDLSIGLREPVRDFSHDSKILFYNRMDEEFHEYSHITDYEIIQGVDGSFTIDATAVEMTVK